MDHHLDCKAMGGIHVANAVKFKIKKINRNSVDVEFTVGADESEILNMTRGDIATSHFFLPIDGVVTKHSAVPDFPPDPPQVAAK